MQEKIEGQKSRLGKHQKPEWKRIRTRWSRFFASQGSGVRDQRSENRKRRLIGVRGLPLIHDKTVDEWGTAVLGYFMIGPPAVTP
jgi:hypothetical protein